VVSYPISVKRNSYRGREPHKRARALEENRVALELERYINEMLEQQQEPICSYLYHEIAGETGHDVDLVRRLCFAIDCGGNGFTAIRRGMTFRQAVEAMGLVPAKQEAVSG
jgi:hypothetical protein